MVSSFSTERLDIRMEILSIKSAAKILGVSDETLRNWEKDGKLKPFHTEGGHRRYYKADIEKLAGIYVEPVKTSDGKRVAIGRRSSQNRKKKEKETKE